MDRIKLNLLLRREILLMRQRKGKAAVRISAVALYVALSGGCALMPPPHPEAEDAQQQIQALEAERENLKQQAESRDKEMARLQLQALEKNARIQELEAALNKKDLELQANQERLQRMDNRAQALTGPAEAAAFLAEAEAGLQVVLADGGLAPEDERALEVRGLLETATAAYESGEYGKAADLSDRAMRTLSEINASGPDAAAAVKSTAPVRHSEEALFAPVTFRVRVRSNLRAGPGTGSPWLAVLEPGTLVTGIATCGQWVKVLGPEEQEGWIYRKLLEVPD